MALSWNWHCSAKYFLLLRLKMISKNCRRFHQQPCYLYCEPSQFFTTVEIFPSAEIAQLGERQTEDLKVPGSNPENSHE